MKKKIIIIISVSVLMLLIASAVVFYSTFDLIDPPEEQQLLHLTIDGNDYEIWHQEEGALNRARLFAKINGFNYQYAVYNTSPTTYSDSLISVSNVSIEKDSLFVVISATGADISFALPLIKP